jgi:thiamine-monophosphate kinase
MNPVNEIDMIEKIARRAGRTGLKLGIGDDCAIFSPPPGHDLLFTTDQMIEGVHFRPDARPEVVGRRALARSLSDIAAMGGIPRFCLVALAVPQAKTSAWVDGYYRGLLRLAKSSHTPLAGGDLAHDDHVHCDVMVCGSVERGKALRRDGARVGDLLYVSGPLGKPWDRPIRPRLELGRKLIGRASACLDLSDGISLDLHRLAKASGVAAEVERVPIARGSTLERALHGGEDYELLFTMPASAKPPQGVTRVGTMVRGVPGQVRYRGELLALKGYDHFSLDTQLGL